MSKNDLIKDLISKIEEEIVEIKHEIDELEKRMERTHQRRILKSLTCGVDKNILNM